MVDLPEARLQSGAKYLGTTSEGRPVTAQGLGGRGTVRILLSDEALDVVRLGAPFRIPVSALRGARHEEDTVVVTWEHGERRLDSAFRLTGDRSNHAAADEKERTWVRRISKVARNQRSG